MTDSQLQPIDLFHRELKSLAAAGIVIDLGIEAHAGHLNDALDQIRSALRVRVSLGQTLEQVIAQEDRLPQRYRAAAQAWLTVNSPAVVLDTITDSGDALADPGLIRSIRLSLLQMLMTLVLISIGLLLTSLWLSPKVDAIYAQLHQPPSPAARFLTALRDWVTLGAIAPAFFFSAAVWWCFRSDLAWTTRWAMRLPMIRRRHALMGNARLADCLASWLQQDLPLREGIDYAAALRQADLLPPTVQSPPEPEQRSDKSVAEAAPSTITLPPLMHWAVEHGASDEPLPTRLHFLSELYRELADRQVSQLIQVLPMMGAACLAGLAVMLYGLAIFLPIIELMKDISIPEIH